MCLSLCMTINIASQCTRTNSLEAFFEDFVSSSTPKIALVGCGCSPATEPVAEISHYWNISQVSYVYYAQSQINCQSVQLYTRSFCNQDVVHIQAN